MAHTLYLDASNGADIHHAADLLRDGLLVAFPTETVYGLGANALSAKAVASIFAAKQRPSWDPLIVHLADAAQLSSITAIPPALQSRVDRLTETFWPGPLTLLLPRKPNIPDAVTAGRELVGVRVPAHPVARALLASAGIPIAAPSANRFGHTSPTAATHVFADLDTRIDAVLDGGATAIGLESTVLDPTQTPMVLYRPGAITAKQLTEAAGIEVLSFTAAPRTATPSALPSPGVGIRHYAPTARMVLTAPTFWSLSDQTREESLLRPPDPLPQVGVLLPNGWPLPDSVIAFHWGDFDAPEELARNLFAGLRSLDDQHVHVILAPLPPPGGLYDAIRDRLQKAARP
jgi:L-threonylcarbamoyladenylate synthase